MALSRRRLLALLLAPALLAGCGPSAATTTPSSPPTGATALAGATSVPPAATSVAGASTSPVAGGTPAPASAAAKPAAGDSGQIDMTGARRGGRLIEGWLSDIRTLNPIFVTDPISLHATGLLFNGLIKVNPTTLQPEGDLAERWSTQPDGKGYRFTLRKDIKFHDGRPCTAEDVKFTYDLLLSERVSAPRQADLTPLIESVTAVSPTEVEILLKQPSAPFLVTHGSYGIVPRHVLAALEPGRIEQSEFSAVRPVGTGPFAIKQWVRGTSLVLGRFDGYFGGQPYLDEVILKVVPDQELLNTQLKLGEVDLGLVRETAADEMSRQQNLQIRQIDSLSITFLTFQLDQAKTTLFQDKRVRQALGLALDRQAMVRIGRAGIGRVATGAVPPPSWAASDQLTPQLRYDPAQAEQLLDGAGWRKESGGVRARDGKRLSFELLTNRGSNGNRLREQYAQLIQDYWRTVGVEVKINLVDFQEIVNRLRRTHEFDVCLSAYAFGFDPDQRLLWSTDAYRNGFNGGRFSNPALDKLMDEAVQTSDTSKRRDLYLKIQELMLEEAPAIILDYPQQVYALNRRLRNVIPNPVALHSTAHQWWVIDGK